MKNLFKHSLFVLALSLSAVHAEDTSSGVSLNEQTVQLSVSINGGNMSTTCVVDVQPMTMTAAVSDLQTSTVYSSGGAIDYSDCTSGANMLAAGDSFTMQLRGADGQHIVRQVDGVAVGASTADANANQNLTVDFYLTEGQCGASSVPVEKITITRDTAQQYSLCARDYSAYGSLQHVGNGAAFDFDVKVDFVNM